MIKMFAYFVVITMTMVSFVAVSVLQYNKHYSHILEQNLNLSARVLKNSIINKASNMRVLAIGEFEYMEIDKEKLLSDFYDVLYKNYNNVEKFEIIKSNLIVKILIMIDRFYICGSDDVWREPIFFIEYNESINKMVYFNILNSNIYYIENTSKKYMILEDIGITLDYKNDFIISRINNYIGRYTRRNVYEKAGFSQYSLKIMIKNKEKNNVEYKVENRYFNALEGITFLIIYADEKEVYLLNEIYNYKKYNISGYTFMIKK